MPASEAAVAKNKDLWGMLKLAEEKGKVGDVGEERKAIHSN